MLLLCSRLELIIFQHAEKEATKKAKEADFILEKEVPKAQAELDVATYNNEVLQAEFIEEGSHRYQTHGVVEL